MPETYFWIIFFIVIFPMILYELGIFTKKPDMSNGKKTLKMTCAWMSLAMLFCAGVGALKGSEKAVEFLTGYIIELSLSIDNVFVFIIIFEYFKVPKNAQHRVLFWGIIGAMVMRLIMIDLGIYVLDRFNWVFYIFGAFLIYSGIKICTTQDDHDMKPEDSFIMKLCQKYFKVTKKYHGQKFLIRQKGKIVITPLFIVLLMIENSDLVFALDSIPAVLAVSKDHFIVFTSNIFAILGLRSLYFTVAHLVQKFSYLKYGIALILVFVGTKIMLVAQNIHIATSISLALICIILTACIALSIHKTKHNT